MFRWKKLGKVFDPADVQGIEWMKEYAQSASALIMKNCVRVYFSCRPSSTGGNYLSYLGYVDLDRKNLMQIKAVSTEPILPLGELGTFDEFGTNPASVIRVGNEVRIYYCGWTRCESVPFNSAIGVAISTDDGTTFNKLGKGPVLSYTSHEPFLLGSPKIKKFNDVWYLWYAAGSRWIDHNGRPEPIYKIRMAHSKDGINWTKEGRDIISVVLEPDECQASADVIYLNGKYHMFFSYRYSTGYRGKDRGYRIGYASSDDLIKWHRDDSKAGIQMSEEGWDSEMISYSHTFQLDNKTFMLYQGNYFGKFGFGLAELEN